MNSLNATHEISGVTLQTAMYEHAIKTREKPSLSTPRGCLPSAAGLVFAVCKIDPFNSLRRRGKTAAKKPITTNNLRMMWRVMNIDQPL
jgi:hypothetical protein